MFEFRSGSGFIRIAQSKFELHKTALTPIIPAVHVLNRKQRGEDTRRPAEIMNKHAHKHMSSDPVMARMMELVGPCPLRARRLAPFQSLIQSIIYQQLSGKAASTILSRFQALFVTEGFPSAKQIAGASPARLRGAGLSGPKSRYVLDLAQRAVAGELPTLEACDAMDDEAIIERLTQTKGVGRWTVEMFLIFNLGRENVLPVDDLGVRRGFMVAYGKRKMPEPDALRRFGRRWAPHRTTATWYLWRAADAGFQFTKC